MDNFYDGKRVLVTGGHGFLGTHLVRKLRERSAFVIAPTRNRLDLTNKEHVDEFLFNNASNRFQAGKQKKIDIVFHLAAHVGGIHYNKAYPLELVRDNSLMAFSVIELAYALKAKLVAAGSVCEYPFRAPVPCIEENLYNGYPEESNGAYGNAKRILLEAQKAAWEQLALQSVHLVSANLYGPGDNFDPAQSHVIPALIMKVQKAIDSGDDKVVVWGTGRASRDFLYVEDAVGAYLDAGELIDIPPQPINIASNNEVPIHYLISKIADIMGFSGTIEYDETRPDGQPRRAFKIDKMRSLTGWEPKTSLDVGLAETVKWYRRQKKMGVAL